jgi:LysM repeat protein
MLSLLRSRRVWGLGLLSLIPSLLICSGCSGRPENSPVVRKKFQELAEVQTQMGDVAIQVKQMAAEMAAVRTDMVAVKALNGGGEAVAKIDQIDSRISSIEQEITKMREALTADAKSRQVASSATRSSVAEPTTESKPSSASASAPARTESRPSIASVAQPSASSSVPARQVANTARPKPRGTYYTIQTGDTPENIASKHGVALDQLLQANRLPKDATIFPGQKLYVPARAQ